MAVNTDKTKYIIFHPKGKYLPYNIVLEYNNNNSNTVQNPDNIHTPERISSLNSTPSSRSYKLLGVLLDENLNLAHITPTYATSYREHCSFSDLQKTTYQKKL
jgi:hypothetical protein